MDAKNLHDLGSPVRVVLVGRGIRARGIAPA